MRLSQQHRRIPGDVELGLSNEVVQPSECTEIPVSVGVVEMLLLVDGIVTGGSVWQEQSQHQYYRNNLGCVRSQAKYIG